MAAVTPWFEGATSLSDDYAQAWFDAELGQSAATGAMSGSASITWSQSGTAVGAGALLGTAPVTWSQTGALTGAAPT
jgi:hypothetical protein